MDSSTNQHAKQISHRARWLVAGVALLLGLSLAQVLYRATLPTDGWSVYTTEVDNARWLYDINLVGAPSGIQQDDELLAVDGIDVAADTYIPPPLNWKAGEIVTMTFRRSEDNVAIDVPVVYWTGRALWRHNATTLPQFVGTVGAFLFMLIAWFTFWRRPEVPSAHALLVLGSALGAAYISGLVPGGLSFQFDRLAYYFTIFFSYIIFGTLFAPALLTFSLLFPKPKRVIVRHPWLVFTPFALGAALFVYLFAGGTGSVGWYYTLGCLVASVISLIHAAFTQRDRTSRAQLAWAIGGMVLGLGCFALNFPIMLTSWIQAVWLITLMNVVSQLGLVVMGLGFSVAILRYRLFDIDVIIRKTLTYTILTALLALVYFGSVVALQTMAGRTLGEQSSLTIVISTLLIAALFVPLRNRIQAFIDRRFFRRKYDAQQALADFGQITREQVDLAEITAALTAVVEQTIQPESVTLWLKEQTRGSSQAPV